MKKLFFLLICFFTAGVTALNAQTCNAGFGWQANPSGNNLLNVDFTNNSTSSASPGANTYIDCTIDYGDGTSAQWFGFGSPSSSHNYPNPGSYMVTVTIHTYDSSSSGSANVCDDTETGVVTVSSSPCSSTVATQDNGNGSFTYTATSSASGLNYSWDFGDGTSGTGNPVTHTYTATGNYSISLTSSTSGCSSVNSGNSVYAIIYPACSTLQADFSSDASTTNDLTLFFSNTSQASMGLSNYADWYFGDGSSSLSALPTGYNQGAVHTYSAAGTYTVTMVNHWYEGDTGSVQSLYCTDTVIYTVDAINLNYISGNVFFDTDSLNGSVPVPNGFKVWLIVHDIAANTLTAVDSSEIVTWQGYQFNDKPAGDYLVKAAALSQPPSGASSGWLPTYHDASVYWSSADNIAHTGGISSNKDIHLQNGTPTSGPGFVGGNISAGAGKGTGTGIEGMLVYLRGSNNQLIALTVTDADGDYSFSNIATGTYSVYPEAINYNTTPFNTINVTSGQAHIGAIDFEQTSDEIKPKNTTGITKVTEKDGLKIYPNPAKNSVSIENQNGLFNDVKIMNAVGQLIKEVSLKNGINKVDVSEMNAGIYYLLISGSEGSRSMKFVKQ
jgi:hypothetical protein